MFETILSLMGVRVVFSVKLVGVRLVGRSCVRPWCIYGEWNAGL